MRRIVLTWAVVLGAQLNAQTNDVLATWIRLDAVPGTEATTAASVRKAFAGWATDPWGNLITTRGSGAPRRVVACAMDYSAFVVSQITEKGYLRVRRTGTPTHPLWNQFQEAQRVAISTATSRIPGVVAVPNGHFAALHVADSLALTADDIWIDIGASSRAEVTAQGIKLLDPVFPDRPMWTFARYATGPAAGARAGCAAVASAASVTPAVGQTTYILSTQSIFGWVGLSAALTRIGPIDRLAVASSGTEVRVAGPLDVERLPRSYRGLTDHVPKTMVAFSPAVLWPGSTVESIDSTETSALVAWVADQAGLRVPPPLVSIVTDSARRLPARRDKYGSIESLFMKLADLHGVAGHERAVREAVLAALPAWARNRAEVDDIGNVIVSVGPDRAPIAMIAHMDEVGWEVDRVLPDGRVALRSRGGAVMASWESVPALLHFDEIGRAPLRGVFVPRDSAITKMRSGLRAWFGMDSAALVQAGVKPGLSLTAYKRTERLGRYRVTARGSDDRTGSTALLLAVRAIKPEELTRRVYFVWSVQEEGGLNGARAFGGRMGRLLQNVYAIDTFVSSDTPVESPHFAYAPLGDGVVLRGLDDGSLAPRAEIERVSRIARANAIPFQLGTTRGSTDGSAIAPWGPPNLGLSWPGRYSHGPAEVLDLRDVDALVRLVTAIAKAR